MGAGCEYHQPARLLRDGWSGELRFGVELAANNGVNEMNTRPRPTRLSVGKPG